MTRPTKIKTPKVKPTVDADDNFVSEDDLPQDRAIPVQSEELRHELEEHTSKSPILSGGDVDAAWEDADSDGDETVGGTAPTPGQDVVEELGRAVGLTYNDDEPLNTDEKLRRRDEHRWELNPASAEDEEDVITWDEEEDDFDLEDDQEDEAGL